MGVGGGRAALAVWGGFTDSWGSQGGWDRIQMTELRVEGGDMFGCGWKGGLSIWGVTRGGGGRGGAALRCGSFTEFWGVQGVWDRIRMLKMDEVGGWSKQEK